MFNAGTLPANTTPTLQNAQSVGHMQFSGTGWIVQASSPSNILTLSPADATINVAEDGDALISAGISSSGFAKLGPGVLTLSGLNTITGTTSIDGGSLLVNSSVAAVSVGASSLLGGNGVTGAVTTVAGATVSPGQGTSAETLTIGSLSGGAWTYSVNVAGPSVTDSDRLVVAQGDVASMTVHVASVPSLGMGVYQWLIAEADSFSSYALDLTAVSGSVGVFDLWSTSPSSGPSQLYLTYNAVPEATTLLLGLAGLTPVLLQRRGSKRA